MTRLHSLLVYFLLATLTVGAQGLKTVRPDKQGFSAERLARIDSMLAGFTGAGHKVAGAAVVVLRNGNIVYHTASGYRNIEKGELLQKDDIFRIASQTKAVTATAVMMLYEEGKIALDDPVSRFIPEFARPKVMKAFDKADTSYIAEPASREITIRDLLTHTSGISYAVIGAADHNAIYAKNGIPIGFEPKLIRLADKMKALGRLPLVHNPGERYTYGLSIDVLGYVVEIVSGLSLNQFFRQRIFEPLGMKDTYFYLPREKQGRLVTNYTVDKTGATIPRPEDTLLDHSYPLVENGTYYSGGAGLSSTVYDYALFMQMLLNGGELNGKRILSPHTVRLLTGDQRPDQIPWTGVNSIGFCVEVVTEKGSYQLPWHKGTFVTGGFWGTHAWADPTSQLVVVVMGQHSTWTWGEMLNKLKAVVYGALME